jgi:DNA-directed RNA polymerase specialized sigma24 family protein
VLLGALRLTRSREAAEELTQKAFTALMTTRPWDPSRPTSLERHLFGIVKSLKWADGISKGRAIEHRAAMEHVAIAESGRSAEVLSLERARRESDEARATRRVQALQAKLGGREPETSILASMAEGIKKPAELAARLETPVGQIHEALARIRRYMKTILAAEGGEDEEAVT